MKFAAPCLAFLLLVSLAPTAVAARTIRYALVLGNNSGHAGSETLRYAETDARKVREVLTEMGGFEKENTFLLLNHDEAAIWKTLRQIELKLSAHKDKPADRTLLFFYFSGHADGDVLELGKSSLKFEELRLFLEKSSADVRLAFLDSCASGRIIGSKGGRKGPGYTIRLTDEMHSSGYAIITSSAHNELSQESQEIHGAYFTHYLVSALRGAGDLSADGKVTLKEAYHYAYSRTLARTSSTIGGSQHPMYDFQLKGRGDIVLTSPDAAGLHVIARLDRAGRLLLVDESREFVVAEAELGPDQSANMWVPAGSYVAFHLSPQGEVRAAQLSSNNGGQVRLTPTDFQSVELTRSASRGGLFASRKIWTHHLGLGGLVSNFPLEGAAASYGATLYYRLETPVSVEPTLHLNYARRDDVGRSEGYSDLGALLGLGYTFLRFSHLHLRAEGLVGIDYVFQRDATDGTPRNSIGMSYLGLFGAVVPLRELELGINIGAGGRLLQISVIEDGERRTELEHRLDWQGTVTLGWRFATIVKKKAY